jgi:phospholipid/cholesterol/gamma-HCH transport system permease protein
MSAARSMIGRTGSHAALLVYALSSLKLLRIKPIRKVFYRQVYFTGWEAMRFIGLLGLLFGAMVATQTIRFAGGESALEVTALSRVIVRELGPLLAAMIIIARSGPAITTELALIKSSGEMASLERMGILPLDYLVVPRILAVILAVVVLTIHFQLIAILGGLAVSALFQDVSFLYQLERFLALVNPFDLLGAIAKSIAFGLVISSIFCYQGMQVTHAMIEAPQAAIKVVTRGMVAVFLLDLLYVLALFEY